jgi:hypothetical protein
MLPAVAALVMGSLSRKAATAGARSEPGSAVNQGEIFGRLAAFLDADKDGSILDDVLGMARRLF